MYNRLYDSNSVYLKTNGNFAVGKLQVFRSEFRKLRILEILNFAHVIVASASACATKVCKFSPVWLNGHRPPANIYNWYLVSPTPMTILLLIFLKNLQVF